MTQVRPRFSDTECEMCRWLRRDPVNIANLVIYFPLPENVPYSNQVKVCLCPEHTDALLHALNLSSTYDSSNVPSDLFSDKTLRDATFGDDLCYCRFVFFFQRYSSRFCMYRNSLSNAINMKDWVREVVLGYTRNWSEMHFYMVGDDRHRDKLLHSRPEDAYFYADFLYRFLTYLYPNLKFLGDDCYVYISMYHVQQPAYILYQRLPSEQLILYRDFYYWGVSTNSDCAEQVKNQMEIYGVCGSTPVQLVNDKIPLKDFDENALLTMLRYFQKTPRTDLPDDIYERSGKWNVTEVKVFRCNIGLRFWDAAAKLIEYLQ